MKILYRKTHDGLEFFQHEGSEIKEIAKIEVRLFTLNRLQCEGIIDAFRQAIKDHLNKTPPDIVKNDPPQEPGLEAGRTFPGEI